MNKMRQDVADALGNLAVLAPIGDDAPVEIGGRQAVAERNQPTIER